MPRSASGSPGRRTAVTARRTFSLGGRGWGGGAGRRYVVVGLAGGRADATSFFLCSFNIFYDFKYGHVVRGRV